MKLQDLGTGSLIEHQLIKNGIVPGAITAKVKLFQKVAQSLTLDGTDKHQKVYPLYVPGRIEVLGKHTDYAGGKSLVMAADRGICLVAAPNFKNRIKIIGVSSEREVEIDLKSIPDPKPGHWSNYPITVIRRLMTNFPNEIQGCTIAFGSDLPIAAGMSSSSALIIAVLMALMKISNLHINQKFINNIYSMNNLAEYAATIENGLSFRELSGEKGVGTFGGSEDHTAILNCHAGMISEFSYCPIEFHQNINISGDYLFVVAASGVKAKKTGNVMNKYNRVSLLVREIKRLWEDHHGNNTKSLNDILTSSPNAKNEVKEIIDKSDTLIFSKQDLFDRLDHFINENYEIIPTAVQALMAKDYKAFGEDVDASQLAAETLLKNQVPETKFLCRSARRNGAVAASAFGAGFGGSVWALIDNDKTGNFIKLWQADYNEEYPIAGENAGFFICRTGPAAFYIDNDVCNDALNRKIKYDLEER